MKSALLVASCLAALVAGSARAETELVVAAYPPFDESVKLAIPRFERLHPGVKVKLVSRTFGDHHNAMISALASGEDVPDVVAVEQGFVDRLAASAGGAQRMQYEQDEVLEDLTKPPYRAGGLLKGALGFTRPQARSRGRLVAIPADVGPGTLFYRKDILDRAGVTEEQLTRSWESYIEAGKRIRAATGAFLVVHANDIKDVAIRTPLKDGEGIFFDLRFHSTVNSDRFRRAFELAKVAREARLDANVAAWSHEWAEGLRNGTIATQMMGSWFAGHLQNWVAPDTKGLWRAAQLPGGGFTTWGGSFYAIPRRAEHKREAWALVRFLCFDRRQQLEAFRKLDAWPALIAAQDAPWIDEPMPFLGGQKARRLWKVAAARAPALPRFSKDPAITAILDAELENVLEKGKGIEQALADAPQQIYRVVEGRAWIDR